MNLIDEKETQLQFPVAIVVSRFNEEVTAKLLEGALARLRERGFHDEHISVAWVPGAVELPIVAQRFASSKTYDAVICLGAVIRGETSHYDYVCEQASQGCQRVALDTGVPVIFGVLTTENDEQAMDRVGGKHGHKGRDAADAAIETVCVLRKLS